MGVTANTVWEFQTGGDDTFGGGFDSTIANAGTDYSTGTSAHATLTTLSVVGASTSDITVSATDYTVSAQDVGNVMYLTGGSATTGFYQITDATTGVGQRWTMDRAVGTTGQTCPGKMGGCRNLISSNSFASKLVDGNKVYIKKGTMTLSGAFSSATSASYSGGMIRFEGYNSTRGDLPTIASGNQPTIDAGSNVFTSGATYQFSNITFTSSATNGISAVNNDVSFVNCKITSTNGTAGNGALVAGVRTLVLGCEIIHSSGVGIKGISRSKVINSYIHGCTQPFTSFGENSFINCIIIGGATGSTTSQADLFMNCTGFGAETPSGVFLNIGSNPGMIALNNIIYGFTTGVTATTNYGASNIFNNNDFFNNTTPRTNVTADSSDLSLDPTFTSTSGGDFSIGTNLKAKALPTTFPDLTTTTTYLDIGAVQRQEPAAGSTGFFIQ